MAIHGVNPKCYILALFVRDDGARFLLGDDPFEFKDNQLHFQQNTMANDVVEVQGNDGYLLAGQVRRPGTQVFDGYVCNGTNSKEEVEVKRRSFLQFFRRSHFYKVIYVFPNGTAIQRKQGFLVDDPTVQELYQQYPEYHVALNFEDVNYYTYEEDDQGHEIYAKEAIVPLARGGATGGLIWDNYGVVWEDPWSLPLSISGVQFQILNNAGVRAPIDNVKLYGDTYQQTYSGKNLFNFGQFYTNRADFTVNEGTINITENSIEYAGHTSSGSQFYPAHDIANKTIYGMSNLQPNVQYTISYKATGNTQCWVFFWNSSNVRTSVNSTFTSTTVSYTFTTPADLSWYTVRIDNRATSNTISNIQIEAGSPATSYEPYVGGIPAPNPDYPQAVQTVTGEQNVYVYSKNLFRMPEESQDLNGVVFTPNGDGTFNLVGTATANTVFTMNAPLAGSGIVGGNKYTISSSEGIGANAIRYYIQNLDDRGYWVKQLVAFTKPGTFTLSDTVTEYLQFQIRVDNGVTVNCQNVKTQIEAGSTATTYAPYQSQSYPISLTGKNLFNVSATPTYANGVSVAGSLTVTATSSGTNKYALYRLVEAKNYVGSKVCVSCSTMHPSSTNDARIEIGLCNADGTSKTSKAYTNNVNVKPSFTVTDDPSKPYIYVALYASYSSSASVGAYVGYGNVMVNRGSTPGTYASYSPMELCKIGDYQDYIYKSSDDWYVHKDIGHDIANSNTNWTKSSSGTNNYYFTPDPTVLYSNDIADVVIVKSTCFTGVSFNDRTVASSNITYENQTNSISIRNNSFSTKQDLVDYCTSHPIDFYYVLATATDTKITDATLVGQLEALDATRLFIGENNVLVSTPEPNLPATLSFDYYTKFAAIGAEWEEGGTKGATIVNVDAIDNTYPVWELTGPATNPTLSVLTTNTALTYNGTITASQKLVIDMFNKTATLNGTSVIGNISGDFVYMAPGTNRVAYTAGNTDAPDSTIYWQEVVG